MSSSLTWRAPTNFRNVRRLFGIRLADRRSHLYLIGGTGTGKSTLLETLMRQDLAAGHGFALLDPHGDLVARVRAAVPASRRDDVIEFQRRRSRTGSRLQPARSRASL